MHAIRRHATPRIPTLRPWSRKTRGGRPAANIGPIPPIGPGMTVDAARRGSPSVSIGPIPPIGPGMTVDEDAARRGSPSVSIGPIPPIGPGRAMDGRAADDAAVAGGRTIRALVAIHPVPD